MCSRITAFRPRILKIIRERGLTSCRILNIHMAALFTAFLLFSLMRFLLAFSVPGLICFLVSPLGLPPATLTEKAGPVTYIKTLIQLAYWPLFESSSWQATPGKRICRLYVATQDEKRLSFSRAFVRNIAKALSVLTLGFGFLMIAVTVRNQCLHDKIASAVILKRT